MKIEFEKVKLDEGSSFRLLHQKLIPIHYSWSFHFHPEYEIVCVIGGHGKRHVGKHYSNYTNGDLVFIGPNLPHSGFGLNSEGLHEEIVVQINEKIINDYLMKLPEMASIRTLLELSRHGISFGEETKELVTERLLKLEHLSPLQRFIEVLSILEILANSKCYKLLNPQVSTLYQHHLRLQKIFNFVEENFSKTIDIKEIAALMNLSVPAFCNYFKKVMNITFTDFVNEYRIQYACMLLLQQKPILEICFDCGFNNVTYFNKVFKDIMLKTPSDFRKENSMYMRKEEALTA
jgi:AraC-like DNA-binding protein/mannose-6-phosphate isomerase-like protein (cupin superfamily)